jgi:hypothetical protein
VPNRAPEVAIGAVEAALAYFFQKHPDAPFNESPAFGLEATDTSGKWDGRDDKAMRAFQLWANQSGKVGFPLPTNGQPDELSVKALHNITAADLSRDSGVKVPPPTNKPPVVVPPPTKPPVVTAGVGGDGGLLLIGGLGLAAVAMSGGGGGGRRRR